MQQQTTTVTMEQLSQARGETVYSSDGEKIGSLEDIYVDEQAQVPEWIGLGAGLLGTKRVAVPVPGAEVRSDGIYVPYSKEQVKGAPAVEGENISQETEQSLYSHYGLEYSHRPSDTGLPEGGAPVATTGETEVVRAEEELKVGKRETEAGRARLRKWVETEPVEADVELRREAARVTRERVDQPVSGAELGEEEVEVPLRREEPVVDKEAAAKERIGLERDVEQEQATVSDEVRKERVEVEGDAERR